MSPCARGIAGHNRALSPGHPPNVSDHACAKRIIAVEVVRRQGRKLEKKRAGVKQIIHPLAHKKLSQGAVTFECACAPLALCLKVGAQRGAEFPFVFVKAAKVGAGWIHGSCEGVNVQPQIALKNSAMVPRDATWCNSTCT